MKTLLIVFFYQVRLVLKLCYIWNTADQNSHQFEYAITFSMRLLGYFWKHKGKCLPFSEVYLDFHVFNCAYMDFPAEFKSSLLFL